LTAIDISQDSQATLLLCSNLAISRQVEEDYKPLTLSEWNKLAKKLAASSLERPSAILTTEADDLQKELGLDDLQLERVQKLLSRKGSLAIELTRLADVGIWVLTRSEPSYPCRFKKILKDKAPVILYGAGNLSIINNPAIGIVGSRDVDDSGIIFTENLSRRCTHEGITVVSGGARGVDSAAQDSVLAEGGKVVSILSNGMDAVMRKKVMRQSIVDNRLLLLSPYNPRARFNVGFAMGRNKLIYALGNFAVVISATEGKGGTWSGAIENAKHGWVPLFVRDDKNIPDGNRSLINRGGFRFNTELLNCKQSLLETLTKITKTKTENISQYKANSGSSLLEQATVNEEQTSEVNGNEVRSTSITDLFEVVWGYIQQAFEQTGEIDSKTLAEMFKVNNKQMQAWLQHAVDQGDLKKLSRLFDIDLVLIIMKNN